MKRWWQKIRGGKAAAQTTAAAGLTCREMVELVTDYLEGALDPATATRFDTHLGNCEGCREYVEQMRQTVALVGQLREEHLPDDARARLLEAFRDWRHEAL